VNIAACTGIEFITAGIIKLLPTVLLATSSSRLRREPTGLTLSCLKSAIVVVVKTKSPETVKLTDEMERCPVYGLILVLYAEMEIVKSVDSEISPVIWVGWWYSVIVLKTLVG
jgi:hypothetical protein